MEETQNFWRKCSSCKKPIGFQVKYYVCSVSTCNGLRTGYVFCSMDCWERHLPGARHRDAAAVSMTSPTEAAAKAEANESASRPAETGGRRIIVSSPGPGGAPAATPSRNQITKEILIVASKLKDYIRARSEMNTSAGVMEILSDIVRDQCDEAIERARRDGRKTVMDRDFKGD